MSYLRKVGMSSFIEAGRDDERGANRVEPRGAGSLEGTLPRRAGLSDPGRSGPAGAARVAGGGWNSNGGSTLPSGSASAAPISACAPARRRHPPSAYGLRGLPPSKTRNQNANTIPLPPPLEEDISIRQKSGHFYFALTVLEHSKFMIFSASAGNGLRNEGKVLYLVGSYPYAGPVPASGMGPGSSEVF